MIIPAEIHLYCAVCGSDLEATAGAGEVAVSPCAHCAARALVEPLEDIEVELLRSGDD